MDFSDEVKKTLTEILAKYAAGNAEIQPPKIQRARYRLVEVSGGTGADDGLEVFG
jgi:hypothetical protein